MLTEEELAVLFVERVTGDEWWTFVGRQGIEWLAEIEREFYAPGTPANRDYEVVLCPDPIVFVRRSRLPAEVLAERLTRGGSTHVTAAELNEHPAILWRDA
jgi:hypothetical protein